VQEGESAEGKHITSDRLFSPKVINCMRGVWGVLMRELLSREPRSSLPMSERRALEDEMGCHPDGDSNMLLVLLGSAARRGGGGARGISARTRGGSRRRGKAHAQQSPGGRLRRIRMVPAKHAGRYEKRDAG
jgi:hypothetical protein